MARGLGKASELIFVKVSIKGVEVDALVDTGATTSCCRWDWYQGWKDHLGALTKSKVRVIGVGHDPVKVKGLTKPLNLHWDRVGGQFQLMVLTALTDVDVVLGIDVLRQLDVKIDFKKQKASPAREPSTLWAQEKAVGLLLDDPGFTFTGKIPAKEEGVEEVAKNVLRPCYREIHRVCMASARPVKTRRKRKDRKIDQKSSMPWDKTVYKAQLGKDLQDIQDKLSRILGRKLVKNDSSFVKETSLVKSIEGGVLVDLCMQRSGKRGSGCDVPNKGKKLPRSADGSLGVSKGFPTPLTSSLMPPKPPRTKVREDAWRKNEICMFIRLLKPSESKKKKENHREGGEVRTPHLNYEKAMTSLSRHEMAMTSLSLSRQEAEGENRRDSFYMHRRKLVTDEIASIYQYRTSMHLVKPSESKEKQKGRPSHLHQSDVMDDAIKVGKGTVNRRIARKHHTASEHSSSLVRDHNSAITMNKHFLIRLAFILLMVINVIRSGFRINSLKRKWVIGLATLACVSRETRQSADRLLPTPPYSFGGKCSCAYILSHTNVYASWMHYFDKYINNLDFEYETSGFFKLVYIYMYAFDSSWMTWNQATLSSKIATLACNKLYTLVYFLSKWGNSGIKTHDKYSRYILFGLTLAYKVSSRVQCIFARFCTNWRELQPLVTSWAYGIKVSFEPCIGQKQLMPSYALVSNSPLSLSPLSSLSPLPPLSSLFDSSFVLFLLLFLLLLLL